MSDDKPLKVTESFLYGVTERAVVDAMMVGDGIALSCNSNPHNPDVSVLEELNQDSLETIDYEYEALTFDEKEFICKLIDQWIDKHVIDCTSPRAQDVFKLIEKVMALPMEPKDNGQE